MKRVFCFSLFCFLYAVSADGQPMDSWEMHIRPLLADKCFECHNTGNPKGGVNLDNYKEKERVVRDGQFWLKVLDQIRNRDMPPKSKPPLSESHYTTLVNGINQLLQSSLKDRTPGQIVIRRLSHSEYRYTIQDLLGVDFDARNYFPSDGSGGGGFDNQGAALFFTPLKLERYYDAASEIVNEVYAREDLWRAVVPVEYKTTWWDRFSDWIKSLFSDDYTPANPPALAAEKALIPFATKAYRRFLKEDEKQRLLNMFNTVYDRADTLENPSRFNQSILQAMKAVLVSPHFLYRAEEEPERQGAYPLNGFEMATRLSYFLWSSMPDQELFDLAYKGRLQDTLVLEAQVRRMLADPKARRFAENFSSQWLGITKLLDPQPMADPEKFPDFDANIRGALYAEATAYFYHVLTGSRNFLDLVSSNYTFLNKDLARYYGIEGVDDTGFQKVLLPDSTRGGVLGMGSVLSVTSLPLRTSPVLRGKWVMEEILGISPPPPPPEVADLPEDEGIQSELGLRKLLEVHRSKPACFSCHQKMDPLGLGLENFDAVGRWRTSYGQVEVDASGVMADGAAFSGPAALKRLLLKEKEKIARNLSSRMLSYALGRGVLFTDEPALRRLDATLLQHQFDPEPFLIELVKSYPFRLKQNDFREKVEEVI